MHCSRVLFSVREGLGWVGGRRPVGSPALLVMQLGLSYFDDGGEEFGGIAHSAVFGVG